MRPLQPLQPRDVCMCVYKQLELPLYETAMQKMRSLAGAVLSSEDLVEQEIDFIRQSVTQLLKARHVLKCSYVYGFYLEQTGYKKPIFEFMQVSHLSHRTETNPLLKNRL